jgi:VRR-NUC domain-containing protein
MKRARMSGKVLQATIIELAHMYGWRVAHFKSVLVTGKGNRPYYATPVSADGVGFPDLVLCRPQDRVMFVEVKGDGDKLRPEQEQWLDDLRSVGAEVYVWTRTHLDSGEIATRLQEHRPSSVPFHGW